MCCTVCQQLRPETSGKKDRTPVAPAVPLPPAPHGGVCDIRRSRWSPGLVSQRVCLTLESMTVLVALFFSMTVWKLPSWCSITRQRNREEIWGAPTPQPGATVLCHHCSRSPSAGPPPSEAMGACPWGQGALFWGEHCLWRGELPAGGGTAHGGRTVWGGGGRGKDALLIPWPPLPPTATSTPI